MQKENIGCYKKSMSCREVVTRHLRIFVFDGIINGRKEIRRSWIKSGMTPLFNNNAFTLIELLVVVLLIGILAAVALPQYQLAVAKSRLATMRPVLATIKQAEETYYLTNGSYTNDWSLLDIDLSACRYPTSATDLVYCGDFVIDPLDSNGANLTAHYCPGTTQTGNKYWGNCDVKQEYTYTVWLTHSTKPDQIECNGLTGLGQKVCNTLQ